MQNDGFPVPMLKGVEGKHLLIALSGGADSVALLMMLSEARLSHGLTLTCAHVDHGIRPDSNHDAEYCRSLCKGLDIPLHTVKMDVPNIAKLSGEGLETCARRVRYQYLRSVKASISADYIALAHHMDDQAETVLMHLFRGTGPEGIAGMDVFSGDLFRPILHMRKKYLEAYLCQCGIKWCTDSTNFEADNPRNVLRLHAIPAIEKCYPYATGAVVRYARSAAIESELVARLADDFAAENLVAGAYGTLLKLPDDSEPALVRRVIRRICGPDLSHDKLNELAALAEAGSGKTDVSRDMFAERGRLGLYFLPKRPVQIVETPLEPEGVTEIDGFCRIEAVPCDPVPIRDDLMRQAMRRDALKGAVVRTRRDGDRIRPLGCGEKLLSDYFTDRKIDRPLRDFIPLVAKGKNILWAAGVGISEDVRIRSSDDICVLLTCKSL